MAMKIYYWKGYVISFTACFYWALGKPFTTLRKAKKEIDKLVAEDEKLH